MAKTNPTSRTGVMAHGSSCNKNMHVAPSHLNRFHRACKPKNAVRKAGSCKIVGGIYIAPPKVEANA